MKLILSAILLLLTFKVFSEPGIYVVEEEDNFETIIHKKLDQDGLGEKDYTITKFRLERYNPNIRDWNHLKEGTHIFFAPPLSPAVSNFAKAYLKKACEQNRHIYKGENSPNNEACLQ